MVHQGNEKQWSPEQDIRRCYDQEHFHPLHTLAFHSPEVVPHFPVFLDGTRPLKPVVSE